MLSIGGAGISGTAALTCTGAPKGASCPVPATMNVDAANPATFNVTASTTSRTMAALRAARSGWFWAIAILGLIVLSWSPAKKKTINCYLPLAIMSTLLLSSCGSSSNSNNGSQPNPNGTPAGTYNLTVTATQGTSAQSANLTLTVQ